MQLSMADHESFAIPPELKARNPALWFSAG
jgi:hypothetical protein